MGNEQRSVCSKFTVRLGLATLVAEVVPVRRSGLDKETNLSLACPECKGSMKNGQRYECPAGCGIFKPDELVRARGDVVLDVDEVAALSEVGEKATLDLHVCSREELERETLPSKNVFRLRFQEAYMAETYEIFRRLAEHPTLALYGTTSINGNIKASGYRLTTREGQLVLQSLIRPQDIAAPDEIVKVEPRERLMTMAEAIMESFAEPLDLTVFTDERKAKLEEILASKGGAEVVEKVAKPIEADALLAALERSLEATSKKKKAA